MNAPNKGIFQELEEYVVAVGITIMFLMETLNVVCRFVMPSWTGIPEEISIFAYIWVCFFCASYCTKKGANIIVDAFTAKYPKKVRDLLDSVQYVVDGILTVLFLYGSVLFVWETMVEGKKGVTGIPLWIVYLAPLAGFSLNLIRDIQMFRKAVASHKTVERLEEKR